MGQIVPAVELVDCQHGCFAALSSSARGRQIAMNSLLYFERKKLHPAYHKISIFGNLDYDTQANHHST
jgi:hypothetical protein